MKTIPALRGMGLCRRICTCRLPDQLAEIDTELRAASEYIPADEHRTANVSRQRFPVWNVGYQRMPSWLRLEPAAWDELPKPWWAGVSGVGYSAEQ